MDYAADLLFVVNNSDNAMILPQRQIAEGFGSLLSQLRGLASGVPSLHIGVTTTDLGAGSLVWGGCAPGGDDGALLTSGCVNPMGGAPYLIYALPAGCEVDRAPNGDCTSHDCTQAHCAHEPTTNLVEDPVTGCPRCVNFDGESLQDAFACLTDVGVEGCAFSQPLEAMHRALDPEHPVNTGFLRDNAYLGVLLATDEDDCSASDPDLFDNSATELDSPLGPLTSFRCFEFGFTCDINDRTTEGTRDYCVARQDAEARLHPISRYADGLLALRAPQTLVVAAWGGPVVPSSAGYDAGFRVVVARDASGLPEVGDSCTTASYGASPGMRVFELVRQLSDDEALANWAWAATCSMDFTPGLAGVGNRLKESLGPGCLPAPLRGCADPGVEFGTPRAAQTCAINERCLPNCSVGEVRHQGTDQEYDIWLPFCLDVCTAGYCEGNTNPSLAYAAGHPPDLDPDLPVEACWHIAYNERCEVSNYAELRVARHEPAPPRTFAYAACQQLSGDELLCNDGADNDEDCLVDMDDPCCQNASACAQ